MPLISYAVELILTGSTNCVIINTDVNENQVSKFEIAETNLYVPVVCKINITIKILF